MDITQVKENKKKYIELLLLADEQESMVDKYLGRGEMFALDDDGVKAISVVTDEGNGVFEIKNIATEPASQGKGYGKHLINFICDHYRGRGRTMIVGTGDSPLTDTCR
jgi:GNAT superfamily N-acetyltransferase